MKILINGYKYIYIIIVLYYLMDIIPRIATFNWLATISLLDGSRRYAKTLLFGCSYANKENVSYCGIYI